MVEDLPWRRALRVAVTSDKVMVSVRGDRHSPDVPHRRPLAGLPLLRSNLVPRLRTCHPRSPTLTLSVNVFMAARCPIISASSVYLH